MIFPFSTSASAQDPADAARQLQELGAQLRMELQADNAAVLKQVGDLEARLSGQAIAEAQQEAADAKNQVQELGEQLRSEIQVLVESSVLGRAEKVDALSQLEDLGAQLRTDIQSMAENSKRGQAELRLSLETVLQGKAERSDVGGQLEVVKVQLQSELQGQTRQLEDLKAQLHSGLQEALQRAHLVKDDGSAEVSRQMEDLKGQLQSELKAITQAMDTHRLEAQEKGVGFEERLQGLDMRLVGVEGDLPRGRVRPLRPTSTAAGPDVGACPNDRGDASTAMVTGVAQGLEAVARILGLLGEAMGEGIEDWASVGGRLDKAWAMRTKDFAGLPSRPNLFDLLRFHGIKPGGPVTATSAAGTGETRSPLVLPDRREGARLANRLAAAVAFSSVKPGDISAKSAEADASAATPKHRRSSSATRQAEGPSARGRLNSKDSPATNQSNPSSSLVASRASLDTTPQADGSPSAHVAATQHSASGSVKRSSSSGGSRKSTV